MIEEIQAVFASIVTVCELTHALFYLKVPLLNVQCSQIWKLIKLGHNAVESTKNICCVKKEYRWFEFRVIQLLG